MSEKEELSLALSILRKYNMPISPILEYAIQERIEVDGGLSKAVEDLTGVTCNTIVSSKEKSDYSLFNLKEGFEHYLYDCKSPQTARNYLRILDTHVRNYIKNYIDKEADSIYSFRSQDVAIKCINQLKTIDEFKKDNNKWHNAFTASLNSFLKYLIERGV